MLKLNSVLEFSDKILILAVFLLWLIQLENYPGLRIEVQPTAFRTEIQSLTSDQSQELWSWSIRKQTVKVKDHSVQKFE